MRPDLDDVPAELRDAVEAALGAAGVTEGHVAVELIAPDRMRELNREHRGRDRSTDVISFPIDEGDSHGPRELGDVFVCPDEAEDVVEAVVHGVLHLCGFDHERDDGEMLEVQRNVMESLR